jgi:hypothetical protein
LKHNAYYWHNEDTGHSVWNEDDCSAKSIDTEVSVYALNQEQRNNHHHHQQQRQFSPLSGDQGFDNVSLGNTQNSYSIKNDAIEDRFIRKNYFQDFDETAVGEIQEEEADKSNVTSALLLEKDTKREFRGDVTHSQADIVHISTSRDIWVYSICIFINTLFVEGPLAAAEGIIRCVIFLSMGFIFFLMAALFRQKAFLNLGLKFFRESLLCSVTTLTLCIPGAACLVYRRYSKDDDWELAPLPTLLGMVDARRFISFSFGNGSFASNVLYSLNNDKSLETHHNNGREKRRQHQWPCQDSWPGCILLEPRRIQTDMILIVRGEDPFGILS